MLDTPLLATLSVVEKIVCHCIRLRTFTVRNGSSEKQQTGVNNIITISRIRPINLFESLQRKVVIDTQRSNQLGRFVFGAVFSCIGFIFWHREPDVGTHVSVVVVGETISVEAILVLLLGKQRF
jgi:hypothetical protein